MYVFCFLLSLWLGLATLTPITWAQKVQQKGYKVVEQTTNDGTFFAYNSLGAPTWWHMQIPQTAAYSYNSLQTTFYIRPHNTQTVYQVNLLERLDKLPKAQMKRIRVDGLSLLNYTDIQQWQVLVGGQLCGLVLSSARAERDIPLNFIDQIRISQGLRTAFSQKISHKAPCDDFRVPAAMGRLVGYGLAVKGKGVQSEVSAITSESNIPEAYLTLEDIATAKPLDDQGRKLLLLATFPEKEQQDILKMTQNQPHRAVVQMLLSRLQE